MKKIDLTVFGSNNQLHDILLAHLKNNNVTIIHIV